MKMKSHKIGKAGEDLACEFLKEKGFEILERNFRVRSGEIDVIAQKDKVVHFVEVKASVNAQGGFPEERVDMRKRAHLEIAIEAWIEENPWEGEISLDVIAIIFGESEKPQINFFEGIEV